MEPLRRYGASGLCAFTLACQVSGGPGPVLLTAPDADDEAIPVQQPPTPTTCTDRVTQDLGVDEIQEAVDRMSPGEVLCFEPGLYEGRIVVRVSGALDAPIELVGLEAPETRGFVIDGDHVTVKGFTIVNPVFVSGYSRAALRLGAGVHVEGSDCLIEGNTIRDVPLPGVNFYAGDRSSARSRGCVVRGNEILRSGTVGIDVVGRNHLIEQNEIHHTLQYPSNWSNPTSGADADGIRFFGEGHVIRDNFIHDITYADPEVTSAHIDCFQTWGPASNMLFEGNTCSIPDPQPYGSSCQLAMVEVRNAPVGDLTFHRNRFITDSDGYCPINLKGAPEEPIAGARVTHNVFFRSSGRGLYGVRLRSVHQAVVQDNVFYDYFSMNPYLRCDDGDCHEDNPGLVVGHNLVYATQGDLPTESVSATDVLGVDPRFRNPEALDFRVGPESPVCGAGAGGSDIGAFNCPSG